MLPKQLDEKVARLQLKKLGAQLTELTEAQARTSASEGRPVQAGSLSLLIAGRRVTRKARITQNALLPRRRPSLRACSHSSKHPRTLQLRVLPAEDAGGRGEAARRLRSSSRSSSREFFSVTYGAGGSTRERTLDTVLEICAGRASAPHRTSRASARRATSIARSLRALQEPAASATSSRCAATCLRAPRQPASSATRTSSSRSSARNSATGSTSRSPLSRVPSAGAQRAGRSRELQAQGRSRRRFGDHAVLLQRRRLLPLRRRVRSDRASTCRSSPASCRSALLAARALLRRLRRRDPALDPQQAARATATIRASIRAFGLDVVTDLCDRLLAQRRARPALLHAEPGRAHDDDLAAAGALAAAANSTRANTRCGTGTGSGACYGSRRARCRPPPAARQPTALAAALGLGSRGSCTPSRLSVNTAWVRLPTLSVR